MFRELIEKTRTIRRFDQRYALASEDLRQLVDLARFAPSRANAQPLKYLISVSPALNERIFHALTWFGHDTGLHGPPDGERPSGYIAVILDKELWEDAFADATIAAHTILLGTTEKGLGGAIITAIDRAGLRSEFRLSERYEVLVIVGVGKPKETVRVIAIPPSGAVGRSNDAHGTALIPKRALDDLILSVGAG